MHQSEARQEAILFFLLPGADRTGRLTLMHARRQCPMQCICALTYPSNRSVCVLSRKSLATRILFQLNSASHGGRRGTADQVPGAVRFTGHSEPDLKVRILAFFSPGAHYLSSPPVWFLDVSRRRAKGFERSPLRSTGWFARFSSSR